VQKRRTLRRTLLQYQRDCQTLDAPTTGGASNTMNPVESSKLAMMTRDTTRDQTAATTSQQSATGKQTVAAVSFKTPDASV